MKKTLVKFFAGVTAAASLLLAGCTNQLDYLDQTTARNAFNVAGLYVEGLDKAYNGSEVTLKVVTVDEDGTKDTVDFVSGVVADSYTKADGTVVGYQSGTAYAKVDAADQLYDGDQMANWYYAANKDADGYTPFTASAFECYLQVGNDTYKVASSDGTSLENAKLAVPTSVAKTADSALVSRWVKVNVSDGVATFSLANSADEPVNVTLANIKLNLFNKTENEIAAMSGVTITKTAKTGTHQKITLKITGLKDNAGTEVVIGGSDLSVSDTTGFGSNWYDVETAGYKQTISADGEVEFTVYSGRSGNTATVDISGWGRGYDLSSATTEIVVSSVNEKKQDGPRLLENSVSLKSMDSTSNDSTNFLLPSYCTGNYDITITIAKDELDASCVSQDDPTVAASEITIAGICITNLEVESTDIWHLSSPDGYGSDTDKAAAAFIDNIDLNKILKTYVDHWAVETGVQTFVNFADKDTLVWAPAKSVKVKPGQDTFILGFRAVKQGTNTDGTINFWGGSKACNTSNLNTNDYISGEYILYGDAETGVAYLVPKANVSLYSEAYLLGNGKWFHVQLDVSSFTSTSALTLIINNGNGTQTSNQSIAPTSVYYYGYYVEGNNLTADFAKVTRPTCTPTTGKVDVYVFSEADALNAYCWNDADPWPNTAAWPGNALTVVTE